MKNLSSRKVDYSAFQALGVQVLGIAAEHSFSQIPFADSLHLPYPLQGIVRWQWHGETSDFFPSAPILQKVQEMTTK